MEAPDVKTAQMGVKAQAFAETLVNDISRFFLTRPRWLE